MNLQVGPGDALLLVDVQNCFLPGGTLAVPHGDEIIPVFNSYIDLFRAKGRPIFATRDWHPADHCSFQHRGGPWPPHCIAGTEDAAFAGQLRLPEDTTVISKAMELGKDAYSGFEGTSLNNQLRDLKVTRLFVGGLATDYCVLNTVKDALLLGYAVFLLEDAVRAVNVHRDDGRRTVEEMRRLGAIPIDAESLFQWSQTPAHC